jgi:tRNA threonylcarbamoyladenosine biosynthesis protein TsaE
VISLSISPKPSRKRPARKPQPPDNASSDVYHPIAAGSWHWKKILRSLGETLGLGRAIGQALLGGEVLALYGLVGAGKTTLVKGIAEGLRADPNIVASPTFVLIHAYRGRLPLVHADLYRMQSDEDILSLGLDEYFDDATVTAIEWADKAPRSLPHDRLEIRLEHRTVRSRAASLRALGPLSVRLLRVLRSAFDSVPADGHPSRKRVQSASGRRPRS